MANNKRIRIDGTHKTRYTHDATVSGVEMPFPTLHLLFLLVAMECRTKLGGMIFLASRVIVIHLFVVVLYGDCDSLVCCRPFARGEVWTNHKPRVAATINHKPRVAATSPPGIERARTLVFNSPQSIETCSFPRRCHGVRSRNQ